MSVLGLDPLADTLDVRQVPVESLPTTMGSYLGAVVDDFYNTTGIVWLGRAGAGAEEEMWARGLERRPMLGSEAGRPAQYDRGAQVVRDWQPSRLPQSERPRLLSIEEANERGRAVGLRFDRPVPEGFLDAQIAWRRRTLANQQIFERIRADGEYGTMRWLAAGGTELLLSATDPLNVVSAMLPVVGPARYAIWAQRYGQLGAGVARGVIEGAAGNALLEAGIAPVKANLDPDYTMAEAMINIALGAGLGGGLHLGAAGLGAASRAVSGWSARRAPDASATAVERQIASELARFSDDAAPRPAPMGRAIEALAPETRETSLRVALAQMHGERPVDVAPVLQGDPAWRTPAIDARPVPPRLLIDATQAESINAHAQLVARSFTDATRPAEPPADFAPSPEVADMVRRIRAGRGAYAQPREPQSLSQWVNAQGGVLRADGGDLLAQDLGRLVRTAGRSLDDLALKATEAGYYPQGRAADGTITRPDLARFVDDIVADANRARRTYSIADEDALAQWRGVRGMNDEVARWLKDHLNVDPKSLSVRQLQYLLSLPEQMARDQALLRRVRIVERMDDAESLAAIDALDRELADAIAGEEARALKLAEARRQAIEPEEIDADLARRLDTERPVTLAELEALHAERERLEPAGREVRQRGEPGGRSRAGAEPEQARLSDEAAGTPGAEARGRGRAEDGRAQGEEGRLSERTDQGEQYLLDGVRAIIDADRARAGIDAPLRGGDAALPEGGLFDQGARNQTDLDDWLRRQGDATADRHADAAAARRAEQDAASPDLDPKAELAMLMERDGKLLSDADKAMLEAAARPHDEMALAVDALATCRMGGAA